MSSTEHYEIAAGDTITLQIGLETIDLSNPFDVNWECFVSLKPYDSEVLTFSARQENVLNTDSTKYLVKLTPAETDQNDGVYDIVVQLRQGSDSFIKTDEIGLTITPKLIA